MSTTPHSQGFGLLIASADGGTVPTRIEIMPVGQVKLRDGRSDLDLRVEDPAAVIAASFASVAGGMLPIDFAHGLEGLAQADGRAAGWITAMDVESDRIVATVDWTPAGRTALENRDYRFISPVFRHAKGGGAVHSIIRAGLVNVPAIHDLAQVASHQETSMDRFLVEIRGALGLPDDADGAAIVAATQVQIAAAKAAAPIVEAAGQTGELTDAIATGVVTRLKSGGGQPDPAKYAPIEVVDELKTQVASLQKTVTGGAVETAVAHAMKEGKVTPAQKDWATAYASSDLAGFQKYLANAPVICAAGELLPTLKPAAPGKLTDDEIEICAAMGIEHDAYIATRDGKPLPKKED